MNSLTPTTAAFLAVSAILTLAIIGVLLFFVPVPDKNAQILGAVIGYISAMAQVAYAFFFGSTKTSQVKDQTIAAMAGTGTGATQEKL